MRDVVHVALCCDKNYLPYAATTMVSCINGCADPGCLQFHLVALGVEEVELDRLNRFIEGKGSKIKFHVPEDEVYAGFHTERYGLAVYHRISLPFYVRDYAEWVIYLDSDILVVDDIRKLWAEKDARPEMVTGAVIDYSPATDMHVDVPREEYFNSGVLLINVGKWLDRKIPQKTLDYLSRNHSRLTFVDQCSLNVVHEGEWHRLALKWNIQGNVYSFWRKEKKSPAVADGEIKKAIQDPGVIHFIASKKPWRIRCYHPYEFRYRGILRETPFHEGALPAKGADIIRGWIAKPFRRLGQMIKICYVFYMERKRRRGSSGYATGSDRQRSS